MCIIFERSFSTTIDSDIIEMPDFGMETLPGQFTAQRLQEELPVAALKAAKQTKT